MGLEKEKLDTSIIMDEDEFNRSIEPILSKKGDAYAASPDRDPNDINAHLKVKSVQCAGRFFEVETTKAGVCPDELFVTAFCTLVGRFLLDCDIVNLPYACALIHHIQTASSHR